MMKYNILFLILLSCASLVANGEEQQSHMIMSFLKAVSNNRENTDQIIEKYICYEQRETADEKAKGNYKLLKMAVEELQPLLKPHNIDSLDIIAYKDLSTEERDIITADKEAENIYVVKTGTKRLLSILIKNEKIGSFITLRKGDRGFFLLFC